LEVFVSILFPAPTRCLSSRRSRTAWVLAAALFCAGLFAPSALRAQTTASLNGTVRDQTGAAIPKAKVELIETKSGARRTTTANGEGHFELTAIQPSTYDLVVSAGSFESYKVTGIELHAGDSKTVPELTLRVGGVDEEVTVTSDAAGVSLDSPEKSTLITDEDIKRLSTVSRDVTELIRTLPGFSVATAGNLSNQSTNEAGQTMGFGSSSVGQFSANGSTPQTGATQVTSDGVNVTDPGDMGASVGNVNMDMVAEVKVQTSNFGADSAKGPVVINAIGKSGGSSYHGSVYLIVRNGVLNANDWQNNYTVTARPPASYFYPGGNIGGPIKIPGTNFNHAKKLTFFAAYEYYLQTKFDYQKVGFIPTARMLGGDLTPASIASALNTDVLTLTTLCPSDYQTNGKNAGSANAGFYNSSGYCYSPGLAGTQYIQQGMGTLPNPAVAQNGRIIAGVVNNLGCNLDSTSSTYNAAGCIPVDPRANIFAKYWPTPNRIPRAVNGLSSDGYNYVKTFLSTHNGFQAHGRVDDNISDSTKVYVTYNFETINDQAPVTNTFYAGSDIIPYPTPAYSHAKSNQLAINFTKVLNATTTNELIGTGVYYHQPEQLQNRNLVQDSSTGWSGGRYYNNNALQLPDIIDYEEGVPDFAMGYFPAGSAFLRKVSYTGTDNLTKQIRSVTLKAGAYAENTANNQVLYSSSMGQWAFNHFGNGCELDNGKGVSQLQNNVGNFLQGCGSFYQTNGSPSADMRFKTVEFYGNSEWKTTRKLTLTLGIRFQHIGAWTDAHGHGLAVWNPPPRYQPLSATMITANPASYPGISWHQTNPSVPLSGAPSRVFFYSPRVGLAYDLYGNGKTVLRGGWGAYRFHDSYNDSAGALDTAIGVQTYSTPPNLNCTYDQVAGVIPSYYNAANYGLTPQLVGCKTTSGTSAPFQIYALDPHDSEQPVTYNYNLTVDQVIFFKSNLEVSYSGNQSKDLFTAGNLTNQNYIPLGGLFQPDPQTGAVVQTASSQQIIADYRPYPTYTSVSVPNHIAYSNYNSLQASLKKQKGAVIYGLNYTWSKALGIRGDYRTGVVGDPSILRNNYGILGFNRNQAVNLTYSIQVGNRYRGNREVAHIVNNWAISGITSLQSGPDTAIGNGQTNYGLTYTPAGGAPQPVNINNGTYLGTPDISLQPIVTCDAKYHLTRTQAGQQYINGNCFALPPFGSNGSFNLPDIHGPAYFNSDMTLQRTFKLTERKQLEFRLAGFNFINHPLSTFNFGGNQTNLALDFGNSNASAATTPSQAFAQATVINPTQFGFTPYRSGYRIVELTARFNF
jgi:hypothetical protein